MEAPLPANVPEAPPNRITVNQAGYLPGAAKVATVMAAEAPGPAFRIIRAESSQEVLAGTLKGPVKEPEQGGGLAWLAEFSELSTEGTYKVDIMGTGQSAPFRISPQIYTDLYKTTMRSYFLQRCGAPLDDALTGLKHAACHLQPSALHTDPTIIVDTAGGWHDAGDYGKYIPSAAITVGQLLMLAEAFPEAGAFELDGTTLLDEVRYELDWMLKMQRADGAVYHKVTTENFPGWIRPEADMAPLIVYDVGTNSTGLFAAAAARGARAYAKADSAYAKRLRTAAETAWQWLEAHPNQIQPLVGKTGAYLTSTDRDPREWAAAELFALTGESVYETYLKEHRRISVGPPAWDNVADMALLTYAGTPAADSDYKARVIAVLKEEADARVERAQAHPFGVALSGSEYKWGSAHKALAVGQHLLMVDRLAPSPAYARTAMDQLSWVLGRNPVSKSFVTGVGSDFPKNQHHRLQAAAGMLVPGLLVGGPNGDAQDDAAKPKGGLGPRAYVDVRESYSTNEPAINYNGPLVFVSGWFAFSRDYR